MSSFLDKLNQQAASGSLSTPKASDNPEAAPTRQEMPSGSQTAASANSAAPTGSGAPAPARQPSYSPARPEYDGRGGGIRNIEHDIEIDRNYGTKKFLRAVAILLVIALLAVGAVAAFRYFTMVTIPDFTGKTIAEMKKWCIDNDLYLTENSVYSMEAGKNYVISQSEPGGTKLSPGTTVEVTYSLGADPNEYINFPDLKNMEASDIRKWVDENKLSNVNIQEEYSDTAKGSIRYIFTSVAVDEQNFRRGDSLMVYVSRGPIDSYTARTVKDFTGALKSEVDSWCSSNGMTAVYTFIMSDDVGENRVISQSVEKGTKLEPGSTIEFVLSEGPGLVVPDFSDVYKEDAMSGGSGFDVIVKSVYDMTVPYGGFISQSAAAGTRVRKSDNKVTVVYSIGKPYLPDFIGMRESSIPEFFYEFNRKGASIFYTILYVTAIESKGTIVGASHNLEAVMPNTLIEFKVSNGLGTAPQGPSDPIKFITIPDYSSVLSENAAMVNLEISVSIRMNYSDTVPYGKLISQSARAGSLVTTDDNRVTLIYSAGKPFIDNLVGRGESELPSIFYEYTKMGAAVTYEITYVDSAQPKGTVVAVSRCNEYILTTEVIQIQISKG